MMGKNCRISLTMSHAFHLLCARSRLACPKAANSARGKGIRHYLPFRMPLHGDREAPRSRTRKASMTPSGARASTASSLPSRSMPWLCSEFTWMRSAGVSERSRPPGSSVTSCAGPYWTSACEVSSRWSRWPATSCSFWCSVPPKATSFPGSRGRFRRSARTPSPPCGSAAASSHRAPDRAASPDRSAAPRRGAARRLRGCRWKAARPALDQLVKAQFLRQRGDEQRHATGGVQHRARTSSPHHVEWVITDHSPVSGDTNNGRPGAMAACCREQCLIS